VTIASKMYGDSYAGSQPVSRFDLEDPTHLARLESPKLALDDRIHAAGLQDLEI
jgi:hypothetical protein